MYPCVQHFLFPCLCPICVNLFFIPVYFHLSNLCKFSPDVQCLFTLFIFLLAIVIALFVIIAFARILCSRAIYVFLRVSYFIFIFILSSVVYLCPSEMFKDLSARFSKISHESEVLPKFNQSPDSSGDHTHKQSSKFSL